MTKISAQDQMSSLASVMGQGLAMGAVDKIGDIFVAMARKMTQNSPMIDAMLADAVGQELVKFLVATSVRTTCLSAPGVVPKSNQIAKACDLQIQFSTGKLTAAGLSILGDELQALAAIGQSFAQLPPTQPVPDFSQVQVEAQAGK